MRPPRDADAAAAAALGEAFERALTGSEADEWAETDVASRSGAELGDLRRDAWLVERDGSLAGYATFRDDGRVLRGRRLRPSRTTSARAWARDLLALTEARAAELAGGVPRAQCSRCEMRCCTPTAAARALLEAHGYRPVRSFLRMRIDLPAPPPPPRWPDGVVADAFRPGVDAAGRPRVRGGGVRAGLDAQARADGAWRERKLSDPRFDPELWLVARDGDEVCGVALCTPGQFEMGFVNVARRAPAMAAPGPRPGAAAPRAFGLFWERGERRIGLGVDSENPTDARRLYERAGMRAAWRADVHEKVLRGQSP